MTLNWPELNKFCGCCSLNTGIYILGVYQIVISFSMTWADIEQIIAILYYLKSNQDGKPCYNNTGIFVAPSSILQFRYKEYEDADFMITAKFLVIHLLGWVTGQTAVLITMILLLYGTYKKQPKYLKFYLSFNVPSWIFTTYILALEVFTMSHLGKISAIMYTFVTAYQILAARSAYRMMTGKSQFYKESDLYLDTNVEPVTIDEQRSPTIRQRQINMTLDSRHCETCHCSSTLVTQDNISLNIPANYPVADAVETNDREQNSEAETKECNFKEEPIVFDQNQLIQRSNPILEEPHSSYIEPRYANNYVRKSYVAIRPTTLAVGINTDVSEQEKHNFDEVTVIYDQGQLNVGTSPILEDR